MESPEMPKYASSSRKRQLKKDNTKRSGATKTKKRRVDASVASSTINPSPQHQEPQDGLSSGDIAEKLGSAPRQKSKDGALQGITSDTTCSSQPTSLISESPSSLMTDSVVSKQMSLNQSSSSTFPSSIKPPSFSQHLTPKGYIPVPGPSVADTTPINLHLPPKPNASLIDLRTPDEQSKLSRPNIKLLYEGSPILLDTPVSQSISKRTDSDPLAQHSLTSCNTLGTHSGSRQSEGPSLTESFSLADGSISLKEGDKVNETGLSSSHRDDFPGTSNTRQIESVETPYVDQSNLFFEDQLLNELGLPSSFRDNLRSDGRFDDPAGSSSDPLNEAPDAQVVSPAISNDVTVEGVVAPEIVSRVTSNSSTASESFLIDSDEEDQPLQLSAQPSSSAPISLTALERQRRRRARIDAASASRAPHAL
ncbi:hypothetical protein BC829DRAFT_171130 [Chytridium lagenaria]|nr:hypothetical protein BC829DRAFT_171130 [Chytridium lagenaria]